MGVTLPRVPKRASGARPLQAPHPQSLVTSLLVPRNSRERTQDYPRLTARTRTTSQRLRARSNPTLTPSPTPNLKKDSNLISPCRQKVRESRDESKSKLTSEKSDY